MKASGLAAVLLVVTCEATANAEELVVGAMYCLKGTGNPSSVVLSKVLAVDADTVHTRQYTNTFTHCPDAADIKNLSWSVASLPVRLSGFMAMNPQFLMKGTVTPEEAQSVREMKQRFPNPPKS